MVLLEGTDISIPGFDDPTRVLTGFFVSRIVVAETTEEAVARASAGVTEDWASGRYASLGTSPSLEASEVDRLSLWGWVRARNTGYVFY